MIRIVSSSPQFNFNFTRKKKEKKWQIYIKQIQTDFRINIFKDISNPAREQGYVDFKLLWHKRLAIRHESKCRNANEMFQMI